MSGWSGSLMVFFVAIAVGAMPVDAVYGKQSNDPEPGWRPGSLSVGAGQKTGVAGKKPETSIAARSAGPSAWKRPAAGREDRAPEVKSSVALVVEQMGGGALFQKNADAVMPIASITKLMTAMVVLDGAPDLQEIVSIADDDVDYARGSRSRLHVGAAMTRETALLLALMASENRAAHALARHYPGGMPAFLRAMNEKANSLGMRDTYFEDPTGLSSNNVSTAIDLAKMVDEAHRYPLIREFSTTPEAVVEVAGKPLGFHNTNPLVRNVAWDVGLSKTGYIHEAGKCLVMQARLADRPVVIVLLDAAGKLTRVGDANRIKRWLEAPRGARQQASFGSPVVAPPG
ncbi:MAG: D-alanyl-D-alanine endopeptidase [Candidatus Accumulibacter sp.]|nr:D-alanyl-D-alanine endopeptidase [Accumulibacter sp.]